MNSAEHFEALVREHYEPLFRFAMRLTRRECDACDLTQETFCVWAMKGHQLRDVSKAKAWLFTTLHRAFLKGRKRQNELLDHEGEEAAHQLPAPPPEFGDHDDLSRLLPALARVDEVYQAAVSLFYLEVRSYGDIALILDVPVGTVKSRIARGLAQLREILLSESSHPPCNRPDWDSSASRSGELSEAV